MIYTKGLVLKGLLGFGATSSAVYVGLSQKERIAGWFSGNEETAKPEASTEEISKLLDEVGLECQGLESANETTGVDCSKKTGDGAKNIKVKREGSTEFEVSSIPDGSKIKLYRLGGDSKTNGGYNQGLKFVIEEGKIDGTASGNKLEEFETYEIKEGTDSSKPAEKQYYLNRKTKASEKIKVLLGLDTCDFPGSAATTCNLTTEQIKKIKFEGKDGDVTGTGTLQISIAQAGETENFPYGFKFTLTATSEGGISISRGAGKEALTLKNNVATIFNIKKSGSSLTLEESLTQDALAKKVGLSCPTDATEAGVDCSKASDGNIKVKQGDSTTFDVSSIDNNKKIKLYKAESTEGYNKNLKFVIEGGDISGGSSNKLEEFETYEIKEHSGTHYLTRKKKSKDSKRKKLGLPDTCTFPESSSTSPTSCSLDSTNINNIKFDGKTSATLTAESGGTATLKVEVTPSTETTEFPHGFKFTLTPTSGTLTINKEGGNITLNNGTSKQFKIKKSGTSLTLEEAWTLDTLSKKVNLSCTASGSAPSETAGVECTKTESSGNIKVNKGGTSLEVANITQGKIKVYKTSSGETHNEGFKFVIEENDITATNGSGSNKLEQFETYEIKKDGTDWKLVKKTDAKDGIKKALGLDECTFPANGAEQECALDDAKFKKINFDGKSVNDMTGGNSAKLKISKPSNNNDYGSFGYKFVLDSSSEAKISSSLTIAGNTNTEFKIKRQTNSNNITLEKALDVVTLGKKVNLTCTATGTKDCSLENSSNTNVKDGNSSRKNVTFKNGDSSKKLTYEEGHDGYNQGIKFSTSEEICLENGTPSSGAPTSIENGGTGYEIKKDSDGTWYLTKKN